MMIFQILKIKKYYGKQYSNFKNLLELIIKYARIKVCLYLNSANYDNNSQYDKRENY